MHPDETQTAVIEDGADRFARSFAATCAQDLANAKAELAEAQTYQEHLADELVAIGSHITNVQSYIGVLRGYASEPTNPEGYTFTVEHDSNGDPLPVTTTQPAEPVESAPTAPEVPAAEAEPDPDPVLFDTAPVHGPESTAEVEAPVADTSIKPHVFERDAVAQEPVNDEDDPTPADAASAEDDQFAALRKRLAGN